jgi:hypothetical protein
MNLTTLGAIGEFVSGIAVLITLIYLAYQTRLSVRMHEQSVNDLQSQIFSQNADGWVEFFLQSSTDERLASIVGKLQRAIPLEEPEISSAELFLNAFFLRLENTEYQRSKGNVEGVDTLLRKQVSVYSASPDFQAWWLKARHEGFTDWFVQAINSIAEARE